MRWQDNGRRLFYFKALLVRALPGGALVDISLLIAPGSPTAPNHLLLQLHLRLLLPVGGGIEFACSELLHLFFLS